MALAGVLVAGAAGAQWDEPVVVQRKGEGALVIRDGAPGYESKSSSKVKRTFKRGEAVAGFHKEFIATTYEFFEEGGRVRVLYPKPDSALMDDAWMDPEDLLTFTYDCCEVECIPTKASFKRAEWNPCFKDGINKAKERLAAAAERERNGEERRGSSRPSKSSKRAEEPREKPLTNEAVLSMLRAELGDELVIAKIQQAPSEALDVSPEALIKLKQQGVSKAVLDAMIKRAGSR